MFGWQRSAQIPIMKKFCSASKEGSAPPPRRGLRRWTRSLPPYTLSFPLYSRPSRIGGGGFSFPCVHSLCRTLHTEFHKITYATRATSSNFFTHSGDRRARRSCMNKLCTPLLHNLLLIIILIFCTSLCSLIMKKSIRDHISHI